jgi:parallel beta-helix repeat protein
VRATSGIIALSAIFCALSHAVNAATLYVAPNGNASASYSAMQNSSTPGNYAAAIYRAQPGDTILFKPGTYTATSLGSTGSTGVVNVNKSGVSLRAQYSAADTATPVENRSVLKVYDPNVYTSPTDYDHFYTVVNVTSQTNVTIDGFEIDGRFPSTFNGDAATRCPNGITIQYGSSHVTASNNIVHDMWGAGVATNPRRTNGEVVNPNADACDYITITGNTIYNCCFWDRGEPSGISLLHSKLRPAGDTSFHNYIAYNKVYNCIAKFTGLSKYGRNYHTDGNGIIIDSFEADSPYTLIENNICYLNGARGIHVFRSDNVLVRNNTMYKNCQDPDIQDAEFVAVGQNITYTNNIAFGTGLTKINRIGNDEGGVPSTATFSYNLYYNFTTATYGVNDLNGNPLFFNESARDFRVAYNSPAVNSGNTANYAAFDYKGVVRPVGGRTDRGAFER